MYLSNFLITFAHCRHQVSEKSQHVLVHPNISNRSPSTANKLVTEYPPLTPQRTKQHETCSPPIQYEDHVNIQIGLAEADSGISNQLYNKCVQHHIRATPVECFQNFNNYPYSLHTTHQTQLEPFVYNFTGNTAFANTNITSQHYSSTYSMHHDPKRNASKEDAHAWEASRDPLYDTRERQQLIPFLRAGYDTVSCGNDLIGIGAQFDSQNYSVSNQAVFLEDDVGAEE